MNKLNNFLDPMLNTLGNYLPGILGALVVLILGLLLAKLVKKLVTRALKATGLDERLNKSGGKSFSASALIARLVYYILVIYVLMIVLSMLGISDVFAPVEAMLEDFLGAIPKLVKAGIIAFAGYIIAKLVSEAVEFAGERINSLSTKIGFDAAKFNLIKIVKQVVFLFIFIPMLIIALDALELEAISAPATAMLARFLDAIPDIIGAAIIVGVFYIVARLITPALKELLSNVGADALPEKVGLKFMGGRSLSGITANVVFFFIMLAGLTSGLEKLGMESVVSATNDLLGLSGRIVLGLVIMVIGNFIATIAKNSLDGGDNRGLASIAQVAILGVFFSIGLKYMGIADGIVELAFGLTLGAVAVAVALSFGLGGREAAGKQMDHILKRFRKDS